MDFRAPRPQRAILFPIYYKLEEDQLRALLTAARSVGDEGLYISRTERSDPHDPEPQDWFVPSSDISPYADLPLYLETAYYSPGGRWGLLVSRESHALVGGSHSFMDTFMTRIPSTSEQHEEFISNPGRRATSPTGKTADEYTEW